MIQNDGKQDVFQRVSNETLDSRDGFMRVLNLSDWVQPGRVNSCRTADTMLRDRS